VNVLENQYSRAERLLYRQILQYDRFNEK